MRKVGNMRVGSSKSKVSELTEEQQKNLREYREILEDGYQKAKLGVIDWEGEVNPPDEKKEKNAEGEYILFCTMCHKKGDIPKNNWYPLFFTYEKVKALQAVYVIKEANKYCQQKYYVKVAGMKESDFKAGFNGAYTSKEDPEKEEMEGTEKEETEIVELEEPKPEEVTN